jgi:transposase
MVRRHELTDAAWAQIAPLLPPQHGQRGGRWRDHRSVINAILWKLTTGVPWRDLPERYQPWQTCYDRYVRWQRDGTWERLLTHAQTKSDAVGELDWDLVAVDATIVRAHQHAAGARRTGGAQPKGGSSTRTTRRLGAAGAG